jgi:predicted DNA-binding transcriptional regulator AlpA
MSIAPINTSVQQGLEQKQLLRDAEVRLLSNIGRTKRNALIQAGLFPAPIKLLNERSLPGRTSYWLRSEIETWLHAQAQQYRALQAQRHAELVKIANDGINGWIGQVFKANQTAPKPSKRAKPMEAGDE